MGDLGWKVSYSVGVGFGKHEETLNLDPDLRDACVPKTQDMFHAMKNATGKKKPVPVPKANGKAIKQISSIKQSKHMPFNLPENTHGLLNAFNAFAALRVSGTKML